MKGRVRHGLAAGALAIVGVLALLAVFRGGTQSHAGLPVVGSSHSVTATRITNRAAPLMDGRLDEIWQRAGTIVFPNAGGDCFTMEFQDYLATDPSTFTVYYLHDDVNLYIAVETTDDRMVESSADDQSSDGLAGMALQRKDGGASMFRLLWVRDATAGCVSGPPIDRDRMVYDAEWRSGLRGSWNDSGDQDQGYVFEFFVPLGGAEGLGGWTAGDRIDANLVLSDHDGRPGAPYNDPAAAFRKCWWGSDRAEDLSVRRQIVLSDQPPIGPSGDDRSVTARRILPAAAPVVDGSLDDPIWRQAGTLRFPSSVGGSFTLYTANYHAGDPSAYTVRFLHDDRFLYVGLSTDDRKIESAAYDQASDGLISLVFEEKGRDADKRVSAFWSRLDEWGPSDPPTTVTDCGGVTITDPELHFQQGPPRYPYFTSELTWGPSITGTWNQNADLDGGYAFEFQIPLSGTHGLGGYAAGERIPANVVLVDHDDQPGGRYDDCATHYKKFWWGFDGEFFYPPDPEGIPGPKREMLPQEERHVVLDDGAPYGVDRRSPDPAFQAAQAIADSQLAYTGLIRSYQGEMAAHTYDNAVALIALTADGRPDAARRLAEALVGVLETNGDQGFFYDSYNVVDRAVGQGTASGTGPNAWAAFALAIYGRTYDDPAALDAAAKVTRWIRDTLYDASTGGVLGGICHPFEERPEDHHALDTTFPFTSTEQVIDTWHLFRIMGDTEQAEAVASWLTTEGRGWIETDPGLGDGCRQDRRFSTGTNIQCGQDSRLFLDPQSWGSIVANMVGAPGKARGAIEAAQEHLSVTSTVGGETLTGFGDSCLPKDQMIWYGGSAQMIVAYVYDGNVRAATQLLNEMSRVQNPDGSWNHSSGNSHAWQGTGCGTYESFHSDRPHIGETAWNYFALRDVNEDLRLPYSLPSIQTRALPLVLNRSALP